MNSIFNILVLAFIFSIAPISAQTKNQKIYKTDQGSEVYLPLGKISFADSIVNCTIGFPKPYKKFRDSKQALHEPNYKKYEDAQFLSLGCGGAVTLKFTNNGFMNLQGDDLYIFEVGPSKETARVEISIDGIEWLHVGEIKGGKSSIDLNDVGIDPSIIFYFIKITDLKSLCNSKTAGADIDAVAAITSVIKLSINADVLFDINTFELKTSAEKILATLVKDIKKVDKATLLIEGHTDSDGTEEANLELSQNRCNTVSTALKALLGTKAKYDYEIIPYGESKPRAANDTEANKQINRRVEITVIPPKDYFEGLKN